MSTHSTDDDSDWNPKPPPSHNLILNAYSYQFPSPPFSFIIFAKEYYSVEKITLFVIMLLIKL